MCHMDTTETVYLKHCLERKKCPYCGRDLVDGQRVGTGRFDDGVFCSLDCFAKYSQSDFSTRPQRRDAGALPIEPKDD